jgi:RNA polymerase sigma factor (sigma-70 family)
VKDRESWLERELYGRLEGIFRFAVTRTANIPNAEDLSQEILAQIWGSRKKLNDKKAFHAWMWSVARNTANRMFRRRRYEEAHSLGVDWDLDLQSDSRFLPEQSFITDRRLLSLRRELSLLSAGYRKIIVSYYLEGKKCGEIAAETGLPAGTVRWRLHEARSILRGGMEKMREFGERSYAPKQLWVTSIQSWQPEMYFQRALPQNIALAAYPEPIAVEALSLELGVARPYLEEEIDMLVENELLFRPTKEKARTEFVIFAKDQLRRIFSTIDNGVASITEELVQRFNGLESKIRGMKFYGADRSWEELTWAFLPLDISGTIRKIKVDEGRDYTGKRIERKDGTIGLAFGLEGVPEDYPWILKTSVAQVLIDEILVKQLIFYPTGLTKEDHLLDEADLRFCYRCIRGDVHWRDLDDDSAEKAARLMSRGFLRKAGERVVGDVIVLDEDKKEITALEAIQKEEQDLHPISRLNTLYRTIEDKAIASVPEHLKKHSQYLTVALTSFLSGQIFRELINQEVIHIPDDLEACARGMILWPQTATWRH